MKKILFRVDGNETIATGHVMRCLSYAAYFKEHGFDCLFVTASSDMHAVIEKNGFEAISLNSDYTNLENEIAAFKDIIDSYNPGLVIIDSYYVTKPYLQKLTSLVKTLYIDDLNSFDYPVNYILNYSIYAKKLLYNKKDKHCFLGTGYLALRREFQTAAPIKIQKTIKNIFITTGGSDEHHFCQTFLLQEQKNKIIENYHYHIVVGRFFDKQERDMLWHLATEFETIHLYENISNMQEVMSACDVAISAGGSTLYELAFLGVPTIAIITAENQRQNVEVFTEKNICVFGGENRQEFEIAPRTALNKMGFSVRKSMQRNARALFDNDEKSELLLL